VTSIKIGAQAAIVALLIENFTFPVFHQGSQIAYVMGFLVAYCALPTVLRSRNAADRGERTPAVALPAL
jgi:hypothetical protein